MKKRLITCAVALQLLTIPTWTEAQPSMCAVLAWCGFAAVGCSLILYCSSKAKQAYQITCPCTAILYASPKLTGADGWAEVDRITILSGPATTNWVAVFAVAMDGAQPRYFRCVCEPLTNINNVIQCRIQDLPRKITAAQVEQAIAGL